MLRWIVLFAIVFAGAGCALFDEYDFGPPHGVYEMPAHHGGCNAPVVVNSHQTQEPELLRK